MENTKSFTWLDYNSSHRETVESWFDSEAVKYTGCDDGWDSFFEYWKLNEILNKLFERENLRATFYQSEIYHAET